MSDEPEVLVDHRDRILIITINRPNAKNAVNGAVSRGLAAAMDRLAPAELEDVLIEHPHVRDVAVVGVDDAQWGQAIVAVVVPAAGIDPDPEELREYVRKCLRGSRTPDRVVFRDELPTTVTGKVIRREIVECLALKGTKP